MGRRPKIAYLLDSRGIKELSTEEIKAILQAADDLIATGGRSMLAKILKRSIEKNKKYEQSGIHSHTESLATN